MTVEKYLTEREKPGWDFAMIVPADSFDHVSKIYPLKQRLVKEIVNAAKKDDYVKRVIIFGSSVKYYCNQFSDLDICIDWVEDCYDKDGVLKPFTVDFCSFISIITKGNADIVHYDYLDGTVIKDDILERGVVVYDNNV